MSLTDQINLLATRIGAEIKSVRNASISNTLRGPIGGVTTSLSVSGTVTIDPAQSVHQRMSLVGDTTIAGMSNGAEGQRILFELTASGAQRVVTFDVSYELSQAVTTRTFTIPSGQWGYIQVIFRAGSWRLLSAEPQTLAANTGTPSDWSPADHNMLAWSYDPIFASSSWQLVENGSTWTSLKVDSTVVVNYVWCSLATAGSGLTSGTRNLAGVYDSNMTLRATTVDQSSSWTTAGNRFMTLSSPPTLSPGMYYVLFISSGTTKPSLYGQPIAVQPVQAGRSSAIIRTGNNSTTQTSMPSTRPTATGVPTSYPWVAFS